MNYIKNFKRNNKKVLEFIGNKFQKKHIKINKKPSFVNRRYQVTDNFNVTFKKNLIILYDIKNRYSFMISLINRFKFFLLEFTKFNLKRKYWMKLNLTPFFSFFFFKLDLFNNSNKMLKPGHVQDIFIDNLFNLNTTIRNNLNFNSKVENYFKVSSEITNNYLFDIKLLKVKKKYIKNFYYKTFNHLRLSENNVETLFKDNLNFFRLYNLFILFILYFLKIFSIFYIKLYFNLWFSYIHMFSQISTKTYILYKGLINSNLLKFLQYRKLPIFSFLFKNRDEKFFILDIFSLFSINIKQTNTKFLKKEISFFIFKTVSSRGLILYI